MYSSRYILIVFHRLPSSVPTFPTVVDSGFPERLTFGLSFRHFLEEHPDSGVLAEHMHGCLPLDKSSGKNALGVADWMWASWTLIRSFAEC